MAEHRPTAPCRTPSRDAAISASAGHDARNAALYFPRLRRPIRCVTISSIRSCRAASIAGVMARTDTHARRVEGARRARCARSTGVSRTAGQSQRSGERPARTSSASTACAPSRSTAASSGARARCAAPTRLADEYKYVPVRRLALFLEESLYRGTQWVVFEPNDEPLWAQIRLNVGAFMQNLFRQGAFQGTSPREAYFVKCDAETTTQNDINRGIVNILVGFAPLKPAEFVVIQIQQTRRPGPDLSEESPWRSSRVNAQRFDPYKNFKFRVFWEGSNYAGRGRQQGRARSSARTEVVEHREGGDPSSSRKSPGRTKYEADHARARRDPRHRVREVGEQGVELRLRAWAPRSR